MGRSALVYMGSWKELSQRVTHFLCLIVIECSCSPLQFTKHLWCVTSVNLHDDPTKWALFVVLQMTKIKFREVSQLALNHSLPVSTQASVPLGSFPRPSPDHCRWLFYGFPEHSVLPFSKPLSHHVCKHLLVRLPELGPQFGEELCLTHHYSPSS